MTLTVPNTLFSSALQGLLKQRLEDLANREPELNQTIENPTRILNKILGFEETKNQRQWIARTYNFLDKARSLALSATLPPPVDQALEIWPSGTPFSEKLALIEGVNTYLEENLLLALGRNPVLSRRLSGTNRLIESTSPPPAEETTAPEKPNFPLLPEGGLPILRRLIETEPEAANMDSYVRSFLNSQPFPMVAAKMQLDRSLGKVLMINRSFAQVFAWKEDDLKKIQIRDLFLKEKALSIIMKIMGLIGTGGEYTPDKIYFLRGDGKYWHCTGAGIITGFIMKKWPGGPYGFGIFSDFTEIVSPR